MKGKYFPSQDFHSLRDMLKLGIQWEVGDGTNISAWHDNWINGLFATPKNLSTVISISLRILFIRTANVGNKT
ncbi:hypothetical protein FRX31_017771 [Thalictrum thalictroides]|uniref:Uncharacterized protein n=1 Tax=Thalictrum thalictroides TaxID=46969 RepID=A0A7J6W6I2_THATH|nr:hypothetical protein FRX31_017771 [Thalictrum thalictroides]